ncbi:unnamed protein product [Miscanthus lutarioriparius]|uniref:CTP synthase n=1 Tax=Miscanthus lutarioriparius TaxID=422564 RepID=A0A811QCB6_9POAL|nr:unnamed protein product [Miscanthus lutarioriparius]
MKYVLVTGGGGSGIGKTVAASSIGVILKACNPYLNTDAGIISPAERGEVFVLNDGSEVHMDLGDYERFLDVELTGDNDITAGKIYQSVIDKERRGDYLGKTVQIVPHITDAIQEWIKRVAMIPVDGREGPPDVCIIELGGTIGDIESRPFTEALSQFSCRAGPKNFCLVHVSLVPVINVVGEQKTKPAQYSVRCLRDLGLAPDLLACRSTTPLNKNVKEKLSQFCNVPVECIITLHDVPNIWHLPSLLKDQKGHEAILKMLGLACVAIEPKLDEWMKRTTCEHLHDPAVKIAVVGEHPYHANAYHSVFEAIRHASVACQRRLVVNWFPASDVVQETAESPDLHDKAWSLLKCADGVLVPGGFGHVEGKILAAKYARENNVPYLGICLGMQVAVIEFARSNLGLKDANSGELDAGTRHPCLILIPEVNPEMVDKLESAGVSFVGMDETGQRMEILELPSHPYFVGVQFHPEFKSRPGKPSPLFMGLIAASSGQLDTESTSLGLGNRPIPMKVLSGSSFGYPSGRKDGLLGLHSSGAALAR